MHPQLVGAPGGGSQPQQGASVGCRQHLVMGVGGQPLRIGTALQQRPLRPSQRQADVALAGHRHALAHGAVIPLKGVCVELRHAQGVDIAGLGGGHNAGGAPVKAIDGVEAVGAQIVRHSAGYGDRLLRQRGGVHGNTGGLVDQQQILIFVQDVQRIVHRLDVGVLAGQVGHIGGQQVAGAGHEPHGDGCTVDRDGAPELQPAEEAAGDVPQASQQLPDGLPAVGLGDGMGQNSHGTPPVKISIAHFSRMWYTYLTKTVKVRTFYGFQGILRRPAGGYA